VIERALARGLPAYKVLGEEKLIDIISKYPDVLSVAYVEAVLPISSDKIEIGKIRNEVDVDIAFIECEYPYISSSKALKLMSKHEILDDYLRDLAKSFSEAYWTKGFLMLMGFFFNMKLSFTYLEETISSLLTEVRDFLLQDRVIMYTRLVMNI